MSTGINGKYWVVQVKPKKIKRGFLGRSRATVHLDTMEGVVVLELSASKIKGMLGSRHIPMSVVSMGETAVIAAFPDPVDGKTRRLSFRRSAKHVKLVEVDHPGTLQ